MRILHEWGKYLSIIDDAGVERLRYNYQLAGDTTPSAPKPFCHPIRTPAGLEITAEAPLDHIWHRGLWMTWKYVNGVNYWEERQEIVGRQITVEPPTIGPAAEEAILWRSRIAWRDTRDGAETTRLIEDRTVTCAIKEDEALVVDWVSLFDPQEDVILDRTPFTTWGGYGGLVARMTQAIHEQSIVFDDGTRTDRPTGQAHNWGGMEGKLDTGRDNWAAFVFLPSPSNRRYPEPMYGNVRPFSNFFGPAPLFHEPLPLQKGEILRHACRVLILPRRIDAAEVDGYYRDWQEQEGSTSAVGQ